MKYSEEEFNYPEHEQKDYDIRASRQLMFSKNRTSNRLNILEMLSLARL